MSSYYGVIFPEFWTGPTGRAIRQRGGKDGQLLALYLASNRHTNMIGLYRLQVEDIHYETGLTKHAIERGFRALEDTDFAFYDADTQVVWVKQLARIRLGLKSNEALAASDKRIKAINKLYHALPANPFLGTFFDVNATLLHLKDRHAGIGGAVEYRSPSEGALKGLPSQYQKQKQITGSETDVAPKTPGPSRAHVQNVISSNHENGFHLKATTAKVVNSLNELKSRTKEFIEWFQTEYKIQRHGADYLVNWEKDSPNVKRMLHTVTFPELQDDARIMLSDKCEDKFIMESDRSIGMLSMKFNWLNTRRVDWELRQRGGTA